MVGRLLPPDDLVAHNQSMQRASSLDKSIVLGKVEEKKRMRWMDSVTGVMHFWDVRRARLGMEKIDPVAKSRPRLDGT